jgi:molecular chaperone DnaK (HSP70)
MNMPPIVGIDLGTTNSLMAYVDYRTGLPRVIPDRLGQVPVPSRVAPRPDRRHELAPAVVLRTLKERADVHFGEPVRRALIAMPAHFDEGRRQGICDAGRIVGLEIVGLLEQPIAAAFAHGLQHRHDEVIAVYRLGGRTFDISLIRIQGGVFEVLARDGHPRLGGDDFDRAIVDVLIEDIGRRGGIDAAADPAGLGRLRLAAEAAKCELSDRLYATVTATVGKRTYSREITRAELEHLIDPFVEGTLIRCRMATLDAGLTPADVDELVLVGGSTRVPWVRRRVESLFGRSARGGLDPGQVVAMGAAVRASLLETERAAVLVPGA